MEDYQALIYQHIADNPGFVSATFSGKQRGQDLQWKRLVIRPVLLKDQAHLQFSYFDETQNITKNYADAEAAEQLQAALALPFRNFHINTLDETIQIVLSKKGKPKISRSKAENTPETVDLSHNRQKNTILTEGEDIPFLQAVGITTQDGRVKANMRSKFKQINAFLQLLSDIDDLKDLPQPVQMVDFGCGSAYLTFAAYHYLHHIRGMAVNIIGIDLKHDLTQKNNAIAHKLGWADAVHFQTGAIADYDPPEDVMPDIVVALHACDTATDDALAQGIGFGSQVIIAAPCCHHDLQAQLDRRPTPQVFAPVMRYGLLHERMGDILTDSFRSLILRIMGYRVDVLEFVAPDHTPKNLLIRAVNNGEPGHPASVDEYTRLRDYWQVNPCLHQQLAAELDSLLKLKS